MPLPAHIPKFANEGRFILHNHPEKGAITVGKMASEATAKSTAQRLTLCADLGERLDGIKRIMEHNAPEQNRPAIALMQIILDQLRAI